MKSQMTKWCEGINDDHGECEEVATHVGAIHGVEIYTCRDHMGWLEDPEELYYPGVPNT